MINEKSNGKEAIVIIDVQMGLFVDPHLTLYKEDEVLENIKKLIDYGHSNKIPIVYIQHCDEDGEFKKGCDTWEINPVIKPSSKDIVVEKTSWDGFLNTQLHDTLQKLGVEELIIAGMQTEFCLDTTLRRAYSMGYKNRVISDAHTTFDSETLKADQIISHHHRIWEGRFAKLLSTNEII